MIRTEHSVFALSPDKGGVWHYHDGTWIKVGGPAAKLYGGEGNLLAISPTTANVFRYQNEPDHWQQIGGPGASFAITRFSVYGLTPDRKAVYSYDGVGTSWTRIGGAAGEIYGGPWGLVATDPNTGALFRYNNGSWAQIGGAGASFAVTGDSVYGLTPSRDAVYRYDGQGTSWSKIGTAAGRIWGGLWGLIATDPSTGALFGYQYHSPDDNPDEPPTWRQIGGPGFDFSVSYETVFGLSTNPVGGGVYRYDGEGTSWTRIGGPADSIAAALWVSA
ncbi:Tachylectin 2 domain-containing protein OS=Streptomyces aurantiogriseus OX=66870 GN=GCM10010251_93900 PE=4 SV=1 [Streptomyces aurantiogriseus]|uniref:Tachylectin 2 domain-containing protein n=2 Tax=Streptomyces aurantiogriseus TaxID=66870 RepID=A0A918FNY9_9ACTN|nr:hypothetical protein GCM10010251_93900 [Streptomyces aurantiogriseus]